MTMLESTYIGGLEKETPCREGKGAAVFTVIAVSLMTTPLHAERTIAVESNPVTSSHCQAHRSHLFNPMYLI